MAMSSAGPPPLATTTSDIDLPDFDNDVDQPRNSSAASVPHETWFRLLQDEGKAMSPAELTKFSDNDRKMKVK